MGPDGPAPDPLLGDKAYTSRRIHGHPRTRGIRATIAEPGDHTANPHRRGSAGGRPPAVDPQEHRQRNTTKRAINKLKTFRAVTTRTDEREHVYAGTTDAPSIRI